MIDKDKSVIVTTEHKELKLLIENIVVLWRYLLSHWLIIVIFGFGGGLIGLGLSFIIKPKYTAHLSFVLLEKGSGGGGLASLASNFGFAGLLGSGSDNAFSGDNLLEIIKSRYAIEKTLLIPIEFEGEKMSMVEAYIQFNKLNKRWENSKNIELRNLSFPIDQDRSTFSRTQDSVLYEISKGFVEQNNLTVLRKNKKINMVNVYFTSKNEAFSKLFIENLMDQTYKFYKNTRTAQSRSNIDKIQHTADSIKNLYETALYGSAGISQVNINSAMQYAVVPKIKQEYNAQLYGAVYTEVLKNIETLKLDMAKETPIVQIIDKPIYPLKKVKLGKIKGVIYGGFVGGIIIVLFLLTFYKIKELIK
jgi:hypothetical protein